MKKYMIAGLCIVCLAFSAGMRPAFDLGFTWSGVKLSDEMSSITENYTALRITTTVPYSRIVGLYVEYLRVIVSTL